MPDAIDPTVMRHLLQKARYDALLTGYERQLAADSNSLTEPDLKIKELLEKPKRTKDEQIELESLLATAHFTGISGFNRAQSALRSKR